ncbi:MAG: DUF917 domain-containing protein [Dongiaceae bacterium]
MSGSYGRRPLLAEDLESLATGAGVLGTGGGTHPYLELLAIRQLYAQGRRVELVEATALPGDAAVAVLGLMGAPLVTKERLPDAEHALRPLRMMEAHAGRPFAAVMSIEIGSENSILPLMVGALAGLPVLDADAMGRAFPEAQMASFAIGGLPMTPFAIADVRGNEVMLTRSDSPSWTERIGRRVVTEMGAIAATCSAPRTIAEVRAHGILGSVSRAIRLGEAVRAARRRHASPIEAVLAAERGVHLFRGKVADVARHTTGGFVRGRATLEGGDAFAGRRFVVDFQNEFTVGWLDGRVAVTVPDLICILDSLDGTALGTETIRYGQRVDVLSLPAAPVMTSPRGLEFVGPRAFGYELDFVSLHGAEPA